MLSCPIFKTNQIQNVSLDTIRPLLPSQHLVVPSKEASRRRCEVDWFRRLLFGPEDVVILANPTSCLSDMCINGCITLLFSSIKPPNSRHFAVFSTYDLPPVRYNALTDPYGKGHGTPRSELKTYGSSLSIGHPRLVIGSCVLPLFPITNCTFLIAWPRRNHGELMYRYVYLCM